MDLQELADGHQQRAAEAFVGARQGTRGRQDVFQKHGMTMGLHEGLLGLDQQRLAAQGVRVEEDPWLRQWQKLVMALTKETREVVVARE